VDFRVVCSKGFYVRTYAHDIGEKLGCGAHLTALRRTRSGHFTFLPGKHTTFEALKEGRREEVLASMLTLYDVSKLRGA
jgi:tRNA pseudouridine55 synthase